MGVNYGKFWLDAEHAVAGIKLLQSVNDFDKLAKERRPWWFNISVTLACLE